MKPFNYLMVTGAIFAAVSLWICLPHADAQSAQKPTAAPAQSADAQDVQRFNQAMQTQEERSRRVEALLARQEKLMDKQEAAFARFEKVLDTWDAQQKQYQAYLDSLKK